MTKRLAIALMIALSPLLASWVPTESHTGHGDRGVSTGDLDRSVDPCTDFYQFANGAWRAANPIPASMSRWSRRVAAHEANRYQVRDLLEEISGRKDWPAGSIEGLLGTHYASCMDEAGVDAAGLTPLAPLLAEIDRSRTRSDVQRIIRRLHELAVPVPFGIASATDYHEPMNTIANVVAGGLGLPGRDDYLKTEPRFQEARERYRVHVAKVLRLAGMPDAESGEAAAGILALEKRLAEASLDGATAADQASTDHKTTFAQLQQLAPHFDWERYFDEAHLPRTDLNVAEPRFIRQFDKELEGTPVTVWKTYLEWHLLESASPWLSRAFVEESVRGSEMKPRAMRCVESVDALFGEALGRKYVERHFPPAAKAKAEEIARNLLTALKEEVAGVPWMTAETKRKALEKLAATRVQIGYPDTWKDYSAVTVQRNAFWANVAAGRRLNVDEERRQIGKPTNRGLWALSPSSPDAYIDLQLNKLVLPAGFLQPPYFDLDATDAVNYGALGIGLAHDLTHAIDTLGAETDVMGRPGNWWSDADRKAFEARGQCVVDQFEGYFIEPGVHHRGKQVLTESIGDLGGVRVALRALERSMKVAPVPVIDGFTPEQQFFISWGQTSGAAMTLEAQRQLVSGDPHPVPKFRVIGPLSNSPEFQRAFSCKVGAAMVRPPEKRCAVW